MLPTYIIAAAVSTTGPVCLKKPLPEFPSCEGGGRLVGSQCLGVSSSEIIISSDVESDHYVSGEVREQASAGNHCASPACQSRCRSTCWARQAAQCRRAPRGLQGRRVGEGPQPAQSASLKVGCAGSGGMCAPALVLRRKSSEASRGHFFTDIGVRVSQLCSSGGPSHGGLGSGACRFGLRFRKIWYRNRQLPIKEFNLT